MAENSDEMISPLRDGTVDVDCINDGTQKERRNGVPLSALEKFAELRQRREDLSKAATIKLERADRKKRSRAEKRLYQAVEPPGPSTEVKNEWSQVKPFLDINAHLSGPVGHGIRQPKSGMEEKINAAIGEKKYEEAEVLSNSLATREFAVRVSEAFGAKRYSDEKQAEKEVETRKKKRCLHWGFGTKERWQMKGNM